ncbi:MAG: prolipoprotein diacylglyceryl transferase [Oscillospiraceae bacterium]
MIPVIHIVVPTYNICCFLGLAAAALFLTFRVKKFGVAPVRAVQLCFFSAIGMLLGSRLLFVITQLPDIFSGAATFTNALIFGGFVFYGGLFGALAAVKIYSVIRGTDSGQLYNMLVPCFVLFHSFGRVGCFLSGCCYGIEFPIGFEMQTSPGIIRFPVQLAESLCDMIIFAALLIVEKKKGKHIELPPIYMVSYSVCRFLLEFLRGDEVRGHFLCFSTSQWIALGVLAYYGIKALLSRRKNAEVT